MGESDSSFHNPGRSNRTATDKVYRIINACLGKLKYAVKRIIMVKRMDPKFPTPPGNKDKKDKSAWLPIPSIHRDGQLPPVSVSGCSLVGWKKYLQNLAYTTKLRILSSSFLAYLLAFLIADWFNMITVVYKRERSCAWLLTWAESYCYQTRESSETNNIANESFEFKGLNPSLSLVLRRLYPYTLLFTEILNFSPLEKMTNLCK